MLIKRLNGYFFAAFITIAMFASARLYGRTQTATNHATKRHKKHKWILCLFVAKPNHD